MSLQNCDIRGTVKTFFGAAHRTVFQLQNKLSFRDIYEAIEFLDAIYRLKGRNVNLLSPWTS